MRQIYILCCFLLIGLDIAFASSPFQYSVPELELSVSSMKPQNGVDIFSMNWRNDRTQKDIDRSWVKIGLPRKNLDAGILVENKVKPMLFSSVKYTSVGVLEKLLVVNKPSFLDPHTPSLYPLHSFSLLKFDRGLINETVVCDQNLKCLILSNDICEIASKPLKARYEKIKVQTGDPYVLELDQQILNKFSLSNKACGVGDEFAKKKEQLNRDVYGMINLAPTPSIGKNSEICGETTGSKPSEEARKEISYFTGPIGEKEKFNCPSVVFYSKLEEKTSKKISFECPTELHQIIHPIYTACDLILKQSKQSKSSQGVPAISKPAAAPK